MDAQQVRGLHEELPEPVRYHLLLPVDDAATRVETAMGSLATGDAVLAAPLVTDRQEVEELQHDLMREARAQVEASVRRLQATGARATGHVVSGEPIEALVTAVGELGAAEVIVLTRPHVVAEFFHLDWTSRARRKLGVPVLHLLEHESVNEQSAGGGEGISGV
jgi:nucleotide-binding universal stress UspA family protein